MELLKFFNTSQIVKYKQQLIAIYIIISVIIMVLLGSLCFKQKIKPQTTKPTKELNILTAGTRIPAEEVWRDKMQDAQTQLNQNLAELTKKFEQEKQKTSEQSSLVDDLLKNINSVPSGQAIEMNTQATQPIYSEFNTQPAMMPATQVMRVKLNLSPINKRDLKTTENTIPAGSFAKAVLLSGVDALTAISSQGNPIPVLLRIVDFGTLPRGFKSDVKDCHITTGSYGNLASERVHMRLEKLTCVEKATGEITETEVAGFIAGPDGKEGVRGTVVSKDAAFLARSLWGSIFSGVGNVLSPLNRQNLSPMSLFGNQKTQSSKDLFKSGMAEGSSRALDRVSEYYINKAEQLQPIIQVDAGQIVDVIFSEGSDFGNTMVKQAIAKARNDSRAAAAESQANWEVMNNALTQSNDYWRNNKP
jgi:conjugal transfer pilus assembly protein TraB